MTPRGSGTVTMRVGNKDAFKALLLCDHGGSQGPLFTHTALTLRQNSPEQLPPQDFANGKREKQQSLTNNYYVERIHCEKYCTIVPEILLEILEILLFRGFALAEYTDSGVIYHRR